MISFDFLSSNCIYSLWFLEYNERKKEQVIINASIETRIT